MHQNPEARQGVVFLGVPWSWESQGRPFGAGFVGQQFRASFIAEASLTPPLTDSVFMSATNVVIPCGEPTGANGRTDGRTGGSVCCNICNDVGAVYFLDKVILTASSRACAGRRRRLECFPNAHVLSMEMGTNDESCLLSQSRNLNLSRRY